METTSSISGANNPWPVTIATKYFSEREAILEKRTNLKQIKTEKIVGIDCESLEEHSVDIKYLLQESTAEHTLKQRLQQEDIPYLAILPTKTFQQLTSDLPFFTFKNINKEGKVFANVKGAVAEAKNDGAVSVIIFLCLVIGSWIAIIGWGNQLIGIQGFISKVLVCLLSFILSMPLTVIIDKIIFPDSKVRRRIKKSELWPAKNDQDKLEYLYTRTNDDGKVVTEKEKPELVQLILPPAPKDVQDTLVKCKNLNIKPYLVVHENAFQFFLPKDQFKSALDFITENDPIVCSDHTEDGLAFTAIHVQYGDFAEEKMLVDQIEEKFNLIMKKHIFMN
jgi:hypothetical protein